MNKKRLIYLSPFCSSHDKVFAYKIKVVAEVINNVELTIPTHIESIKDRSKIINNADLVMFLNIDTRNIANINKAYEEMRLELETATALQKPSIIIFNKDNILTSEASPYIYNVKIDCNYDKKLLQWFLENNCGIEHNFSREIAEIVSVIKSMYSLK